MIEQKFVIKASLSLPKTAFRFQDKFTSYYLDKFIYTKSNIKVEHSLSLTVKPLSGQCFYFIAQKICVLGKLYALCIDSYQRVKAHCNPSV